MNNCNYAGGYHVPSITPINKILIIFLLVAFLLQSILGALGIPNMSHILGLSSQMLFSGHIYQLITYPLVGISLLDVVINCFLIWFIGGEFENSWGKTRYLMFLLVSTVGGGFFYLFIVGLFYSGPLALAATMVGASGPVNAMLLAYAVIYPDRLFSFMLIFPIKAKYFCMVIIAMQLYMGIFPPAYTVVWGQLGAMVSAFLFMLAITSKNFKVVEKGIVDALFRGKKKSSAHLKLVKNDEAGKDPKYWN